MSSGWKYITTLCFLLSSSLPLRAADFLDINMGFAKETIQGQFQMQAVGSALKGANIEYRFIRRPAARALQNVETGIDDGNILRVAGLEKSYPHLIAVPTPIIDYEFVSFARNELAREVRTWEDLRPLRVAMVLGWKIVEENTKDVHSLIKVENGEHLFQLLQRKRVDVVIYERWQGLEIAQALGIQNIKLGAKPLAVKPMHMYLHQRHAALVSRIDKAVRQLREGQQYADLYDAAFTPLSLWAKRNGVVSGLP